MVPCSKINYQCLKNLFAMFETIFPYSKIYFHDSKFHYTFAGNLVSLRVISAAPLDFKVFLCQRKVFLWQKIISMPTKSISMPAKSISMPKVNESMTNYMLRSNNAMSNPQRTESLVLRLLTCLIMLL